MDAAMFLSLALACAPQVHADTAHALAQVESGSNPWAIGVVDGALDRQPQGRAEAIATAQALRQAGWNFSVGLAQINVRNLARLSLTLEGAFDPCTNLAAMQSVLLECFDRAESAKPRPGSFAEAPQVALRRALSCYYSGNFTTGLREGYVRKIAQASFRLRQLNAPDFPKEAL